MPRLCTGPYTLPRVLGAQAACGGLGATSPSHIWPGPLGPRIRPHPERPQRHFQPIRKGVSSRILTGSPSSWKVRKLCS